ncbi:MAG: GDSL-type esterase/lipase family protein [Synechococcus sp.]
MPSAPRQLTVIGDSGVYGWGDRDGGGWCERLRRSWMQTPDAPVVYPLGVRGDGLESVARRWEREWNVRGERRRQTPDGLLLAVGLNDSAKVGRQDGRPLLSVEAYRFGVEQLIKTMLCHTRVMVLGLTPVDEQLMPFADCLWYANAAIRIYEAQLEEACLEMDVPFLPLHHAMQQEPGWLDWMEPDGLHLNGNGHHWIHQQLIHWPALQTWAGLEVRTQATPVGS